MVRQGKSETPRQIGRWLSIAGLFLCLYFLPASWAASGEMLAVDDIQPGRFYPIVPQGFGDRQNSYTWSMIWWRGQLFVGTGRSTQCVQQATGTLFYPTLVSYPPEDPDVVCPASPQDLDLRAEIWRWTPETNHWERVFQSPEDVPLNGFPGKYVARDTGFRSMVVFEEPDGTEALYVGGVSSNTFNADVPPPRILRSVDGERFEALPQDVGTFLGDIAATSFRSLTVYDGRLYVIATSGYAGFGPVLEASDPRAGNDAFRFAFDPEITAFELQPFNRQLYVGTGTSTVAWPPDLNRPPFRVLRTNAAGDPPYAPVEVVAEGGYRPQNASRSVVSMYPFNGVLYVGTDRPAELLRIYPDDDWELVMGTARWTPDGIKYPLSGMDVGFGNSYNIHVWRMQEYMDTLLVGTMDQSTKWRVIPGLGETLAPEMGFDLYMTRDGVEFTRLSRNGFNDIFDVGIRNFVVTPYGLFMGTANHYYGTKLWWTDWTSNKIEPIAYITYLPTVAIE